MSKADRFAARFAARFAEKQRRDQAKATLAGMTVPEMMEMFKKATRPAVANTTANIPTLLSNRTVTSNSSNAIYGGSLTATINGTPKEGAALPPQHPSDDTTRQMVERAVMAAIERCLAADHYPRGIALTQAACDALKGSPLVKSRYWSDGVMHFLDLPMHIVEMLDPLDVEVGW